MPVNAIIYSRISSHDPNVKTHDNTSIQMQNQICAKYCKNKGYNVINTVSETGSAYSRMPPKLYQLIHPDNEGCIVVCYAVDRFGRNTDYAYQLLKKAKDYGIIIEFVSDGFTTENERHILQIKAEILRAEHESRIIGIRMKDRIKSMRAQGYAFGSVARYGMKFRKVKGVRKLVKDDFEQLVIAFILYAASDNFKLLKLNQLLQEILPNNTTKIDMYNEKGEILNNKTFNAQSNKQIADLMNSYGIKPRNGLRWKTSDIRRIINQNSITSNAFMRKLKL